MKRIIVLFLLVLNIKLFAIEENIYNLMKISLPKEIKITKKNEVILFENRTIKILGIKLWKPKYKYFIKITYETKNNNGYMWFEVYLNVRDGVTIDRITETTKVQDISEAFHLDFYEYPIIKKEKYGNGKPIIFESFILNNTKIKKHIDVYGSEVTSDIITYYFELNNDIFKECTINFLNVWPTDVEFDQNLDNDIINKKLNNNDKKFVLYKIIDETIKSIVFIK